MPVTTVASSMATMRMMSSVVPVRIVTSMNCLLSQIIIRPSITCVIPATMRTRVFHRMPAMLRHIQTMYFMGCQLMAVSY